MSNPMMYVATMAVVTYLIRVLPLTLFNKPITNIYSVISILCSLCDFGGDDISYYIV